MYNCPLSEHWHTALHCSPWVSLSYLFVVINIEPAPFFFQLPCAAVTSTAHRDYSVEAGNGEKQTHRYQLRQNITYYDCEHAPKTIPDAQQLNADHIFVLYDRDEQVIRYATINRIGPARGE